MHLVRITLIAGALTACGNTYHPEYHPRSSFTYQQSTSMPVVVHPQPGQGVQIMPAPAQTTVLTAPPAPPTPPADFPW